MHSFEETTSHELQNLASFVFIIIWKHGGVPKDPGSDFQNLK